MKIDINATKFFGNELILNNIINDTYSSISSCVIHIIDKNTLQVLSDDYVCQNGNGASGKQLLYRWSSPDFGTLGFYCSNPVTYTYDRYEDNKIYVYTWGKFFTVAGNMLIMDGGDTFYTYDPETEYVNVNQPFLFHFNTNLHLRRTTVGVGMPGREVKNWNLTILQSYN